MARQSQGLQVLLIVFVMLAVVLGVTTYLYSKRADEATHAALSANQEKSKAQQETADKQKECETLKTMIGWPDKSTDELRKQFVEEMQTYGGAKQLDADPAATDKPLFEPGTLFYSRLLKSMYDTIQARSDELIRARSVAADYADQFKHRQEASKVQVETQAAGFQVLNDTMKKVETDYRVVQQSTAEEAARMVGQMKQIKADEMKKVGDAEAAQASAAKAIQQKEKEVQDVTDKLSLIHREAMDVPSGDITWVSLPNKTVWINRGRADNLQRQTQFTVFSGDSASAAKAVKKGKVEVTRITGEHEAEARILEDKLTDPIMAGDKVFTPLWSPGQQNHFALAGIMNLDGDGRNQIGVVRGMINGSGGVVDCELDENGKKQGQITVNTRFIVIGDSPDNKSGDTIKNNGEILSDADRYHVQVMKLAEFKQQMGYQKSSSVEHFNGVGASTSELNRAAGTLKAAKPPAKADAGSEAGGNQ
jgi:hypothetical protein